MQPHQQQFMPPPAPGLFLSKLVFILIKMRPLLPLLLRHITWLRMTLLAQQVFQRELDMATAGSI